MCPAGYAAVSLQSQQLTDALCVRADTASPRGARDARAQCNAGRATLLSLFGLSRNAAFLLKTTLQKSGEQPGLILFCLGVRPFWGTRLDSEISPCIQTRVGSSVCTRPRGPAPATRSHFRRDFASPPPLFQCVLVARRFLIKCEAFCALRKTTFLSKMLTVHQSTKQKCWFSLQGLRKRGSACA